MPICLMQLFRPVREFCNGGTELAGRDKTETDSQRRGDADPGTESSGF